MQLGCWAAWLCWIALATAEDGAPWTRDAAAARAQARKAGQPCVILVNSNASALCSLIPSVEATLPRCKEFTALKARVNIAAVQTRDAEALRREFEVSSLAAWFVVLDPQGETLACMMAEAVGLACSEENVKIFPAKLTELIERQLERKESLQALERAWRAKPSDAETLERLATRNWTMYRPRSFSEFCETERKNEQHPQAVRDALRYYALLSRAHGWYAVGGFGTAGRKEQLRAEAETLLAELPAHPKAPAAIEALFETYANGMTFDVPAKIRAVCERLRARNPKAPGLAACIQALETRLAEWRKQAEAERKDRQGDAYQSGRYAALLGDAEATIHALGGEGAQTSNYYKDVLDEAAAKLARQKAAQP